MEFVLGIVIGVVATLVVCFVVFAFWAINIMRGW